MFDKFNYKKSLAFKLSYKFAFTLAEVLITVGIIGIIATIVIPVLISEYQKYTYVESLKKAYNEFDHALQQVAIDYGCPNNLICTGLFATGSDALSVGSVLVKYFKVAKDCGIEQDQGCWPSSTNANYDGSSGTNYDFDNYSTGYKFITADGMSFMIENPYNGNCGMNLSSGKYGYLTKYCGRFYVDVNGLKGPNYYGRDTFQFRISNGKGIMLYPCGGADDQSYQWWDSHNTCKPEYPANKQGIYCAGRVMEEGWQMNY